MDSHSTKKIILVLILLSVRYSIVMIVLIIKHFVNNVKMGSNINLIVINVFRLFVLMLIVKLVHKTKTLVQNVKMDLNLIKLTIHVLQKIKLFVIAVAPNVILMESALSVMKDYNFLWILEYLDVLLVMSSSVQHAVIIMNARNVWLHTL